MSDRVLCTISSGVADVRINRPDKRNALDPATFRELIAVGEGLKAERGLRAVVLSGNGASFCSGLDFASFEAMLSGPSTDELGGIGSMVPGRATHVGQQTVHVWREIEVPVIAAIQGHALGGGLQIAMGADLRIVHPDAQLSVLEIRWGLVPDMTLTQFLPQLVGLDVAKELTFTGRVVSGREAVEIGLATKVSETPLDDALAMAQEIAGKNPFAIRGAKKLLDMAGAAPVADGFAEERRLMFSLVGSPNQIEAVQAFFAKRPPQFADVPLD
ncbi:MAG: crotonase/enoyl-CoA hydratase family protein [Acidimicrobiia bacterium]